MAGKRVAAHANDSVELHVDQGAPIEAMGTQRLPGLALRTVLRSVVIGVRDPFGVLLDGALKRV